MPRIEIFVASFHLRISAHVYCVSGKHIVVILWNRLTRKFYTDASHAHMYTCERTRDICEMPVIIAGILQGGTFKYILSDITLPAYTQHMASVT